MTYSVSHPPAFTEVPLDGQAVKGGTARTGFDVADEDSFFLAKAKGPEGVFHSVAWSAPDRDPR